MKYLKVLFAFFISSLFFSCANPVGNSNTPVSTKNYDVKKIDSLITGSVFRATFPASALSRNINIDNWSILYQMQNDGSLKEVLFKNNDNQDVRLNLTNIYEIGFGFIGIEFSQVQILEDLSVENRNRKAIIRLSDGVAFDFSDYSLETAQVYKDYMYIVKNNTIYTIDIDVMSNALPLNNPAYDPIHVWSGSFFGTSNRSFLVTQNYDVLTPQKAYFFNTAYSPKEFLSIKLAHSSSPTFGLSPNMFLYDLNGALYTLAYNWGSLAGNPQPNGAIVWSRVIADIDNGYTLMDNSTLDLPVAPDYLSSYNLGDYASWSVFDKERYIIGVPYGFFKVTSLQNGLEINWTDLTFPFTYGSSITGLIVKEGYCYWQETSGNKAIKRIKLETGATTETIVNITGVRTGFSVVDGTIIYNRNISALEINTYSIKPGDPDSVLIATSDTLPVQIIPLRL